MTTLTDRIAALVLEGHSDTHIARALSCHRTTANRVRQQLRRTGGYVEARLAAEAWPTGQVLRRQPTSPAKAAHNRAVLLAALTRTEQEA